MPRKNINFIQSQKKIKKITCLTAYTTSIAKIIDKHVDMILIGDSLGTAIYGMKNTQGVTLQMMMNHGRAVFNSSKNAFTIIDMPYNTYRNKKEALINAKSLLKFTKCQSVKLEIDITNTDIVEHLVKNKINVVSHIGITPQKLKNFKKIRSFGKNKIEINRILKLALKLEGLGSTIIFLECVKETLAKKISHSLKIPTIGIGASIDCDGQVLVTNDILNIESVEKKPRFIKSYLKLDKIIDKVIINFCKDVVSKKFPKKKNTYQ